MIKRRDLLGVAALSAFLGAVLGLFLFGQFGGQVTPGPAAVAQTAGHLPASAASFPIDNAGGVPLTTTTFSNVAEKVMPGIVVVTSEKKVQVSVNMPFGNDPFMRRFFGNPGGDEQRDQEVRGLGSGVIVSDDGYILTNNHVVNDADKLQVRLDKHTLLDAQVVGTDPQSDLAVLKVSEKNLPHVELGNSDNLKIGEWVMAIGAPFGLDRSVTVGIVSAKGRSGINVASYEQFIQTDAAINHGNSGGALINLNGELIGINTAIASATGQSNGVGFAIPINMARPIMQSLIEKGKVTRGYLGVNIQDVDDKLAKGLGLKEARGVAISGVLPNTPADKAGLQSNDVILKLNGDDVQDRDDLRNRVAALTPGTDVQLTVLRDGAQKTVTLRLTEQPKELAQAGSGDEDQEPGQEAPKKQGSEDKLGMALKTLTPSVAKEMGIDQNRGVLVTDVASGSRAEDAGLQHGDVILEVNRKPISTVDQFRSAVGDPQSGESVVLRVLRKDTYLFVIIEM